MTELSLQWRNEGRGEMLFINLGVELYPRFNVRSQRVFDHKKCLN